MRQDARRNEEEKQHDYPANSADHCCRAHDCGSDRAVAGKEASAMRQRRDEARDGDFDDHEARYGIEGCRKGVR